MTSRACVEAAKHNLRRCALRSTQDANGALEQIPFASRGTTVLAIVFRLASLQAITITGGVEASCRDCLLPFGLLMSIIGLAATGVAGARDPPGSVLSVLGWVLLGSGVLGVAVSCLWQQYRSRKRCGSWTLLMEPEAKKAVI
uniref:Transmembrane protein 100 n=1 Tax=Podarcis muralis TaxID=64176 RepID=A0A670J358_PODMU